MKALFFEDFGGPEVLRHAELPEPALQPGGLLVRMRAIGLNFADIYRRRGHYALAGQPPHVPGYEGAGVVQAVSPEAAGQFKPGDRVGFADVPFANAELVAVPAAHAIALPDALGDVQAAALLLQGLTAQYLCEDSMRIGAGDRVAIHAAAGGVGRLLVQMCKAKGALVHALVSTPEKAGVARRAGADEVLLSSSDWAGHLQREWGGMRAVFDSVGTTLPDSLSALRPKGRVVLFGLAGGEPAALPSRGLMARSTGVIGADLWDYLDSAEARRDRSARLFGMLRDKLITLPDIETFALRDGADAHRRLESRSFSGKVVLVPDGSEAPLSSAGPEG